MKPILCLLAIHRHFKIEGRPTVSGEFTCRKHGGGCVKHSRSWTWVAEGVCFDCGYRWIMAGR